MTHTVTLGQCDTKEIALIKIRAWAKKSNKSYNITEIERYNYSVVTDRRNYFRVRVEYFNSKTKGKYIL